MENHKEIQNEQTDDESSHEQDSERWEHLAEKTGDYMSWVDEKIRYLVNHHPAVTLLAVVGVGFIIGRMASRK